MISKRQVFAAVALIAIAMTTIAYAQLLTGTITVTTEEVVSVKTTTVTFPARGVFNRTVSEVIKLDFTKGGFQAGDEVLVKVELVIDDPTIHELRSLVVKIKDASTGAVVAVLTLGTPYDEFEVTVPDSRVMKYDADIIAATGGKAVSMKFRLSASIIGWA